MRGTRRSTAVGTSSPAPRLRLPLDIRAQPDETTCGPTCLDAVYRFYGDDVPLDRVISETVRLEGGGTLAAYLACHALRRDLPRLIGAIYLGVLTYDANLLVLEPRGSATTNHGAPRASGSSPEGRAPRP